MIDPLSVLPKDLASKIQVQLDTKSLMQLHKINKNMAEELPSIAMIHLSNSVRKAMDSIRDESCTESLEDKLSIICLKIRNAKNHLAIFARAVGEDEDRAMHAFTNSLWLLMDTLSGVNRWAHAMRSEWEDDFEDDLETIGASLESMSRFCTL